MKNRIARYTAPAEGEEKALKFKNGDKVETIPCLDKKYFDKEHDKDKLIGYVHLKNKGYSGKEYGTVSDVAEDNMDVYSRKKFYQRIVGYIPTTDGEWLAVTKNYLLLLLLLASIIIGAGVFCWVNFYSAQPDVLAPDFSDVVEEDNDCNCDITAKVILPEGVVTFDGEVETPEDEQRKADDKEDGITDGDYEPYAGEATIKVTLTIDDVEHILVDTTKVQIENGQLPDVYIDFTQLDFELQPGIYTGFVTITYPDGSVVIKPIKIVIMDSTAGSIGIGFSDKVFVYRSEDKMTLKYAPQETVTDTIIQVIAQSGDEEILLGQSGVIHSGDTILELPLDSAAKSRLQTGTYKGVIRVYFDEDASKNQTTDLKSDIEVTISVQ